MENLYQIDSADYGADLGQTVTLREMRELDHILGGHSVVREDRGYLTVNGERVATYVGTVLERYPVYVVPTTESGTGEWVRLPVAPVGSRSAAIQAARRAGYRVLRVGGLIELSQDEYGPAWTVTVHPKD